MHPSCADNDGGQKLFHVIAPQWPVPAGLHASRLDHLLSKAGRSKSPVGIANAVILGEQHSDMQHPRGALGRALEQSFGITKRVVECARLLKDAGIGFDTVVPQGLDSVP